MPDDRYSDDEPSRGRDDDYDRGRRDDDERRYGDRDLRRGGEEIPNYLVQSILVIFCCWPFAIAAIVNAAKVNTLVAQGDYRAAQEASDAAKRYCITAFIIGLIVQPLGIILQIIIAASK